MGAESPLWYLVSVLNQKAYRGVARAYLVEAARDMAVRQALYPHVPRGTKDEKVQLAQVFAASGDKESEGPMERLSKDSDAEVGQEALRALRALKARLPQ